MATRDMQSIVALQRSATPINDELSFAECFARDEYRVGYVRFLPRARRDTKLVVHADLDVVCLVLAGRGRLRRGSRSIAVQPGSVCRIPAGTPHDVSAREEPLELLYATIRVRRGG